MFRIIASSVVAPSLEKAGEKAGIVGMFPSRRETAQRVFEGRFSRGEEGMLARRGKDRVKIKGSIVVGDRSVTLKISE